MKDSLKTIWRRFTRQGTSCERYETLISLYADGMASEKQSRLAEAHIAACPECRALLSTIRAMSGAMAQRPEPTPPSGLSERLRLAIAQERQRELSRAGARRMPVRALVPRLALAGALASVVIVALVVNDLRTSTHSGQVPIKPAKVATVPDNEGTASILKNIPKDEPTAPAKLANSSVGTAGKHALSPVISHERTEPMQYQVANRPETTAPRLTSVIDNRLAISRARRSSQTMVATKPATGIKTNSPVVHAQPHRPIGEEVATVPSSSTTPDMHPVAPSTVNNPTTGEQPIPVAALPQTQPMPAVADETPRGRLGARLKLIADNSAAAGQKIANVGVNNEQRVAYSGSLPIVGASIP